MESLIDLIDYRRRYDVIIFVLETSQLSKANEDDATIEVSALVDCISTSHARVGRELVYAYLTGVGAFDRCLSMNKAMRRPRSRVSNQ